MVGCFVSVGRIIKGQACVDEGAAWLAGVEPRFAAVLSDLSPLPLRLKGEGFTTLLDAIISQQVSVASAAAIWERLETAGLTTQEAVQASTDADLKACGLSRPKMKYARALAEAELDYPSFKRMSDDEVEQALVAVPGIGPWTAQIYLMFSMGRADVFASGDLALQEAARMLFDLPERPKDAELRDIAKAWSPWRSVAARLLFAYYKHQKTREGLR